jgi:co-chaperonin GroES (HSP10)
VTADEFEAAELAQHQGRNGLNTSGMQPVEYKILIAPEDVAETDERIKSAKAAGIVMVDKTTDREAMAQVKGTLIAVGGNAFEDWKGMTPEVGDVIYFAKYAGYVIKGADGKEYRLANDKDCSAIIQRKEGAPC